MSGVTISLVDATRFAFAPGGPVEQVLGQHRPFQATFAVGFAGYVATSDPADIHLWMQQQRAGIGKTHSVSVVLALDCLITQRSSVVSTNTRALRAGYLQTLPEVNDIVQRTLRGMRARRLYRPITMAAHLSVSEWLSPSKIAAADAQIRAGIASAKPYAELVAYFDAAIEHGDDPTFDDYFAKGGTLPLNTSKLYWSLCLADKNTERWKIIQQSNLDARGVDILLATHAMLIRNSVTKGDVLRTRVDDEDEPIRTGILVADEADKLPSVAFDALTSVMTHNVVAELVRDFTEIYGSIATRSGREALAQGTKWIKDGLAVLERWMVGHASSWLVINRTDPLAVEFADAVRLIASGLDNLRNLALGRYSSDADRDVLVAEHIRVIQQELWEIAGIHGYTFPKMEIRTYLDTEERPDIRLAVNVGSGRMLISTYWRPLNEGRAFHTFAGVAMISASLTDMPPNIHRYQWFSKNIGVDPTKDRTITLPPIPSDRRQRYGTITEVIVPARTCPHPTDASQPKMINPKFVDFGETAMTTFARLQQARSTDTRMLVLFPSYDLIDAFWEKVPHLHDYIIRMRRGSNLSANIKRYAAQPHGIWFGCEWEGVNFVDPDTHRTLANMLVIPRIPQPPTDAIRVSRIIDGLAMRRDDPAANERLAEGLALFEGNIFALHKTIQGVGRGIRNATDVIDLLGIFDIRFPVPANVADTRKIARSGGDPTKMFSRFDTILEPYGVQHWSQMSIDGRITRII